jgi:hypothetical protein
MRGNSDRQEYIEAWFLCVIQPRVIQSHWEQLNHTKKYQQLPAKYEITEKAR